MMVLFPKSDTIVWRWSDLALQLATWLLSLGAYRVWRGRVERAQGLHPWCPQWEECEANILESSEMMWVHVENSRCNAISVVLYKGNRQGYVQQVISLMYTWQLEKGSTLSFNHKQAAKSAYTHVHQSSFGICNFVMRWQKAGLCCRSVDAHISSLQYKDQYGSPHFEMVLQMSTTFVPK